jgi:hypothetical protein
MVDSNENLINKASLKSIDYRIDLYKHRRMSLPQLTQDLFSTVSGMLNVSEIWHEKFMFLWSVVEEVNAFALAEDSCEPLKDHEELLLKTLNEMQTLAQEGLND